MNALISSLNFGRDPCFCPGPVRVGLLWVGLLRAGPLWVGGASRSCQQAMISSRSITSPNFCSTASAISQGAWRRAMQSMTYSRASSGRATSAGAAADSCFCPGSVRVADAASAVASGCTVIAGAASSVSTQGIRVNRCSAASSAASCTVSLSGRCSGCVWDASGAASRMTGPRAMPGASASAVRVGRDSLFCPGPVRVGSLWVEGGCRSYQQASIWSRSTRTWKFCSTRAAMRAAGSWRCMRRTITSFTACWIEGGTSSPRESAGALGIGCMMRAFPGG